MSLIIVRENFGTVGQCWIVDNIIEGDDFRIISTDVIVQIIQPNMRPINPCVDDGHDATCAVISCCLIDIPNTVSILDIGIGNLHDTIQFNHDYSG